MKCERCGKEATVTVKAIINGYERDFYLCNDCLKEYTDIDASQSEDKFHKLNLNNANIENLINSFIPSLDDMIDSYYEYKFNQNNHPFSFMEGIKEETCPKCGNLQSNIRQGIFGCENCYKLKENLTTKVLKTYNNFDKYVGKLPREDREFKEVALEIKSLQEKLSQSVETEDYEMAASLKEKN